MKCGFAFCFVMWSVPFCSVSSATLDVCDEGICPPTAVPLRAGVVVELDGDVGVSRAPEVSVRDTGNPPSFELGDGFLSRVRANVIRRRSERRAGVASPEGRRPPIRRLLRALVVGRRR